MSFPTFPTLIDNMDSSKYSFELEDNSLSEELEGGYTMTRARTTRKGRKIFHGAYTSIVDSDKAALRDFFETVTNNLIFNWVNIEDGITYQVRFKGNLTFKYVGRATYRRWDCDFTLRQA